MLAMFRHGLWSIDGHAPLLLTASPALSEEAWQFRQASNRLAAPLLSLSAGAAMRIVPC